MDTLAVVFALAMSACAALAYFGWRRARYYRGEALEWAERATAMAELAVDTVEASNAKLEEQKQRFGVEMQGQQRHFVAEIVRQQQVINDRGERLEQIRHVITRRPPRRKWLAMAHRVADLARELP